MIKWFRSLFSRKDLWDEYEEYYAKTLRESEKKFWEKLAVSYKEKPIKETPVSKLPFIKFEDHMEPITKEDTSIMSTLLSWYDKGRNLQREHHNKILRKSMEPATIRREEMKEEQTYRITWHHEVYIKAKDLEDLKNKWEGLNLGHLDVHYVSKVEDIEMVSHEFVELVSVEDENNNEVKIPR